MIELTVERMAAAMGAELISRGGGGFPEKAAIDSRTAGPGDLFFGLRGGSGDGGQFAGDALAAGAWGVVATPEFAGRSAGSGGFVFAAPDPLRSLQALARAWRRELGSQVIGITGSVGKTSVKDITRALLPGRVHASAENFNTEIGLPLTVLSAPAGTGTLVLEMAMRGAGQIAELAEIAEPDVGVITNVGPVHVELLGSIDAVAAAKAELIGRLRDGGTLIAPVQPGALEPHLEGVRGLVRFGTGGDVELVSVRPLPGEAGAGPAGVETVVATPEGVQRFDFPFSERHNVTNALAAIAAGLAVGARPAEMAVRSAGISFSRLRGERIRLGRDGEDRGLLLNDCYNANPLSMRAALEHLAGQDDRPRKVAVLGLMAELGPDSERFHSEVGEFARELGIGTVIGVGEAARAYAPDLEVADTAAAAEALAPLLGPDTVVLVKGSRAAGLEAVSEALAAAEGRDG